MKVLKSEAFLSQVSIDHGPVELFSRFFLEATELVARRGVTLRLATFAELEEVNRQHNDSWRGLFSTFRPELGGSNEKNGFALFGVNDEGDVIATQAIRMFDWSGSNLKVEAEALRLFYADPGRYRRSGEACFVTAPNAREITGQVGLAGAVWYRPDYRRTELTRIIPRVTRAHAVASYSVDSFFGLFGPESFAKKLHLKVGYRDASEAVIMRNSRTFPDGDLKMILCRQTPMQTIDDVFGFLMERASVDKTLLDQAGGMRAEVDAMVDKRRA